MKGRYRLRRVGLATIGALLFVLLLGMTGAWAAHLGDGPGKPHPLIVNGYALDPETRDFDIPSRGKWKVGEKSRYQVLQFVGPIQQAWKEEVARWGVKFFDYLPEYGFIVKVPPEQVASLRRLAFIAYVGPFHPAFRLDRHLDEIFDVDVTVNVIVFEDEKIEPVVDRIEALGGKILRRSSSDLQARLPIYALSELSTIEAVRWVEQARPIEFRNSQTSWRIQSGIEDHRPIWERGLKGEGQIIGVADSGIDWDHECFYDPNHPQVRYSDAGQPSPPDLGHRKIINYWRLHGDGMDTSDHGTHVTGTLACDHLYLSNNSGNPNGQGMAPKARLSFTDLTTPTYFPMPLVSEIPVIFNNQYQDMARIHSDSWGEIGSYGVYTAMSRAMDEYQWNHKEFVVLVANGNQGEVGPPATAKNVVSVGAEANSLGPTSDGRLKPTVVAPRFIISAVRPRCGWRTGRGTSGYRPSHSRLDRTASRSRERFAKHSDLDHLFRRDESLFRDQCFLDTTNGDRDIHMEWAYLRLHSELESSRRNPIHRHDFNAGHGYGWE